jgi:large subunit ribosomal protein L21
MYAVVSSGGKQYRVEPGTTLVLERLAAEPGTSVTFDRVLVVGDGDEVTVGTPVVNGASVSGTVLGEQLGPKIIIFKFKQKVKYRRRTGHRQHLMRVRIEAITADGRTARRAAEPAADQAEASAKPEASATPATPRRSRATRAKAQAPAEVVEQPTEAAETPTRPRRTRTRAAKPESAVAADEVSATQTEADEQPTEGAPASEAPRAPKKTRTTRRSARPKAETSEE